jgi:BMFP domain-containing protein YqiC
VKINPLSEVLQKVGKLVADTSMQKEAESTLKAVAQNSLSHLNLVSRDEFDVQAEVLQHTRQRVEDLENQLEAILAELGK